MPDWTYHPLRGITAAVLGVRRSRRAALHALATLISLPGGRRAVSLAFGHRPAPPDLAGTVVGVPVASRLGAIVPPAVARDAIRALPTQGAGFIVIAPVTPADLPLVREATAGRRCPVFVRSTDPETAAALAPHIDGVLLEDARLVSVSAPGTAAALARLQDGGTVLATPAVLVTEGPGWFQRVTEAATPTYPATGLRAVGWDPRRWPAWWWGFCVGAGMIGGGLGAALITLGPVLLWYDRDFLGTDLDGLHHINHHLVHFLQHDRITIAATMVAIGVLYVGLAVGGIRRGWPWARNAYLVSGYIGFPTLFYFLDFGFLEPLHTAVAVVLFPMFVLATRRSPDRPRWTLQPDGPEPQRLRAHLGQLLMIITGVGLFIGGAVVSVVGLTHVFVPSDLVFLQTTSEELQAANVHLVPFIAHDRAGFGGALMAAAAAITGLSAWGWRRGEAWIWWTLALAALIGFLPPIIIHAHAGYTDFWHLAPVYFGSLLTILALALARPYLCNKMASTNRSS
ncbi:hypothetical protein ACTMTF_48845 [Nonomuraea sp. ZG12]|uniref:hypothetical protein n=1 Tax=Nonomuraea sp. ZG12 TaxID=3452207 RepID=UPI003F8BA0B7